MNAVAPISTPHAETPLKQQYEIFLSINSEGQNRGEARATVLASIKETDM